MFGIIMTRFDTQTHTQMHWYCNKYMICDLNLLNEVWIKSISNIISRVKAAAEQRFNLLNKVNVDNKLYQNKQVIKTQMETQVYSSNKYVGKICLSNALRILENI